MPRVFISYRRRDSGDVAARLHDRLKRRFGEPNVFLDYHRLQGGDDFLAAIDRAVDACDVVLAVIGPGWKGAAEPGRDTGIHDPRDVVRREIQRALLNQLPILPVLVGGAAHLTTDELPDPLKKLATTHALQLRSGLDFDDDLRRIEACVTRLAGGRPPSQKFLAGSEWLPFVPPLSSETSRSRSLTLASLRSGAVLGASLSVFSAFRTLANADEIRQPSPSPIGVVVLVITLAGCMLLIASRLRVGLAARAARDRQRAALRELTTLILSRLETPRLLSATSVRGLAVTLEQKHGSPVITDKLIAEAVRSAAITLEYTTSGPRLEHGIELLNALLVSIDENASELCSIAVVDRVGAYLQSQSILAGTFFVALLATASAPFVFGTEWSWWMPAAAGTVLVLAFLLWLSTERAIRFWGRPADDGDGAAVLTPRKPRLLPDLFFLACTSRSNWAGLLWHQTWGPLWESVLFLRRSERQLAAMHEFRFDVAQELWSRLKRADIELERSDGRDPVERAVREESVRELARDLWVVTGEPRFRIIEARGTIVREDREAGIVGLL